MWPARSGDRVTAWLLLDAQDMSALFELPVPPLESWLEDTYRITRPSRRWTHWTGTPSSRRCSTPPGRRRTHICECREISTSSPFRPAT
ncbi:hypothetical protein [Streptomyces sp. NPDC057428]|uniref:hypothetical protein n=1 Tax=Streptomyces sp. NPDC057428 TaxID=3346129 RepID=UPI0036ACC74C